MEQELDLGVALVAGQLGQAVEEGDGVEGSGRGIGHGDLQCVFADGNTHFSSLREGPGRPSCPQSAGPPSPPTAAEAHALRRCD
ncbi:hypothetical protein AMYX_11780 [Anaeromyxobacter diazotrophicus]|uniref:Uncharacterized protein n=1 Tax=Anaeromyxobacter diazotrophicus TaxID=2590199 RepID=A0A7I9VK97_9BACT|nr:hypothetical protein AMYX_11780 [Anaeromyxobacter diazotrophicus]